MKTRLKFLWSGVSLLLCGHLAFSQSNDPKAMKHVRILSNGEIAMTAATSSSKSDFDFLVGKHVVRHRKLKDRLAGSDQWVESTGTHTMEKLLDGFGNLEQHFMVDADGKPVEGAALRLFDPKTKLWSIYWADSRRATLDNPVIGSFENGVGYFFGKDTFRGKPIIVQFKWDASNLGLPVWSQAFSADHGKTWEWNWYMYFSKPADEPTKSAATSAPAAVPGIGVIELRDYLMNSGQRDQFIDYFEANFLESQSALGGYVLGRYRVKENEDNFCWIRGFENMQTRSRFLPAFYHGDFWRQRRNVANSMLANNDNVNLLRPLVLQSDSLVAVKTVSADVLRCGNRIAVVDFYISNTKLETLKKVFAKQYLALWNQCGISDYSIWESELAENDFPGLPVFQDKNLLVSIRFFKDELEYREKMKLVREKTGEQLKLDLLDAITLQHHLILYPTSKFASETR